ncbi:hypothetical protein [Natronobeatus ordinarius]|uniref:hypothetical protein n=1 Tax=Natronobeatus ordinarius TaxID=2963433 RepID=UPI0020CF9324|nr:hypothetical protein [Natronobeatus ordinarius]
MMDLLGPALVGGALVVGLSAFVYRDARRVDVGRPRLWAAIVFGSCGAALLTYLFVPAAPVPGLLALAVAGPVLYALERDDAKHGDEPADPHTLADGPGPDSHRESAVSERTDDSRD